MEDVTVFEYPIKIRERHLDTFEHVNNAVYLQIFEEARWEIINKVGYGISEIRKSGLGPVVLEINIRFAREISLGQEIIVKTQLASYDGKIAVLKQWMEGDGPTLHCEASFKIALFDVAKRKIVLPTDHWKRALGMKL